MKTGSRGEAVEFATTQDLQNSRGKREDQQGDITGGDTSEELTREYAPTVL